MENNIFLGLGSNIGNKLNYITNAVDFINSNGKCIVESISSVYESKPYGGFKQENYFNAVISIRTELLPDELLLFTQSVERHIGRNYSPEKWAPREIDVDIIFYNQLIYNNDELKIPHPEALKRDFVIVPLKEIAEDFVHPVSKKKIAQIDLSGLEKNIIRKLDYPII